MAKVVQMTDFDGVLQAIVVDSITGMSFYDDTVTVYCGNRVVEFTTLNPKDAFESIIDQIKYPDSR